MVIDVAVWKLSNATEIHFCLISGSVAFCDTMSEKKKEAHVGHLVPHVA